MSGVRIFNIILVIVNLVIFLFFALGVILALSYVRSRGIAPLIPTMLLVLSIFINLYQSIQILRDRSVTHRPAFYLNLFLLLLSLLPITLAPLQSSPVMKWIIIYCLYLIANMALNAWGGRKTRKRLNLKAEVFD